jgi:GAF domain-containing protein/anti-sigma regulatory factor (Ser/Thr protein kinase)
MQSSEGWPLVDGQFVLEVSASLAEMGDAPSISARLVDLCVGRFCDACAVYLLDDGGVLDLVAMAGTSVGALVHLGESPISQETLCRDGVVELPYNAGETVAQTSLIVVPLCKQEERLGLLAFVMVDGDRVSRNGELCVAEAIGRQLTLALDNATQRERVERLSERLRFVTRTTEQLLTTLDERETSRLLVKALSQWFGGCAVVASVVEGGLQISAIAHDARTEEESVLRYLETQVLSETGEARILEAIRQRRSLLVWDESDPSKRPWIMGPLASGDTTYGAVICCCAPRRYDASDLEVLEDIGRRACLALQHAESFARERRLTQTLQQATLPSHLADVPGALVSACYIPASAEERVGGDWYDAFDIDDRHILVTIGDVTGHGLGASIVMGKLRHALNVVGMYESDPTRIIDVAEDIVLRRYPEAVATAFVAVIDSDANTITYANAGHPYPLLRRHDGTVKELISHGLPIGLRSMASSGRLQRESLDDVALLVFFTDGLTEGLRDPIEGQRRLLRAVEAEAVLHVRSAADFIRSACLRQVGIDDVAVLAFNFVAENRWAFASDNSYAARRTRSEMLRQLRVQFGEMVDPYTSELIFGELVANVVRHAPGLVDVSLERRDGRPVLHFVDRGSGRRVRSQECTDVLAESGRGLWLIRQLGGGIEVERVPGYGTHVLVTLPIAGCTV